MAALKNIPIILLYVFILGQVQAAEPKAKVDVQVEGENKKFAKTLQWVDKETGEILFDIDDIIRFDWEKQIFELTRSAAMDFMARLGSVGVEGRKFILKDGMMIIYEGTLVTPASSFAFAGAVIRGPLPDDNVRPPLFEIGGGYPEDIARGDSRFSERLKKSIEQPILLSEIDLNKTPAPIVPAQHSADQRIPVICHKAGIWITVEELGNVRL